MIHTTLVLGEQFDVKTPILVFTADNYDEINNIVFELHKHHNSIIIDTKNLKFNIHMYKFIVNDSFYSDATEISGLLQTIKTKLMNKKSLDNYVSNVNDNTIVIKHKDLSNIDKILDYIKEKDIDICNIFVDSKGNIYYRLRFEMFGLRPSNCVSLIYDTKNKLESIDCDEVKRLLNKLYEIYQPNITYLVEDIIANYDVVPKCIVENNEIRRNCVWIGNYETPIEKLQDKYNSIMENHEDMFTTLDPNLSNPLVNR